MEHRFAIVLSADLVGYSRLMGADEEGTLAALKAVRREIVDPKIAEHKGRIVRTMGDGLLVEFTSVLDAVRCAIGVQQDLAGLTAQAPAGRQMLWRIGINMGDVIADGDAIYGDGVTAAARLESLAEPGGINVSRAIRDQVRDRLPVTFEDLGEHEIENLARPVRVFRIKPARPAGAPADAAAGRMPPADKPSLAVLPFHSQGGDESVGSFLDSLAEDLITELARARWFDVVARNTSFTYKGRTVDSKQVAADLGVRYIVEGSLRRSGTRVRIACQLVEAASGQHLWAERFDGTLEDSFDLQDSVIESAIGAIAPALRAAEVERARRKPEREQNAYDLTLRAMAPTFAETAEGNAAALRLLGRALELGPTNAAANALAAWCRQQRHLVDWPGAQGPDRESAKRLARAALAAAGDEPLPLALAGAVRATLTHDHAAALAAADRAVMLSPNSALVLGFAALTKCLCGAYRGAVEHAERAVRLGPAEPFLYLALFAYALALLRTGRNEEALVQARRACEANRNFGFAQCTLAMCLVRLDCMEEAAQAVRQLLDLVPRFRIASLRRVRFADAGSLLADLAALRAVGLPD